MSCHCHKCHPVLAVHAAKGPLARNPLRADPSRTGAIRRAFVADWRRRRTAFVRAVYDFVVTQDAFALAQKRVIGLNARDYEFKTSSQKMAAFKDWLQVQIDTKLLSTQDAKAGRPWTAKYIESAYKKGVLRSYSEVHAGRLSVAQPGFQQGSKAEFLRATMGRPERMDSVQMLATRTWNDMEGVTQRMGTKMNRVLAEGLANGGNPKTIARDLVSEIGLESGRAEMIARTETAHAQADGQLAGFAETGVEEIGLVAEVLTAGDDKVCDECQKAASKTYTLDEAAGMIPLHPNCVLGTSKIECPDGLALTRAKFFGLVVHIRTRQHDVLSVTENHILLTKRGWIRAKDLRQGDQLFDASSIDRAFLPHPHQDERVPKIEDVFSSLVKAFPENLGRIALSSPEDFHGDGRSLNQEVDVILSDGKLRDEVYPELLGELKQMFLMGGNIVPVQPGALPEQRALSLLMHGCAAAADGFVGRDSVPAILRRGSLGHHQSVGLLPGSELDPGKQESTTDCSPTGPESFGDTILTLPGNIATDEIIDIQISAESAHDGVFAYDIWSHASLYALNGILSSNCRCAWTTAERAARKR